MQIVDELKDCKTSRGSSKHTIEDFIRRTLSRPVLGDLPRSGRPKDKKASKRAKAERGRVKRANAERGITLSAKFGKETTQSELASTLSCSLDDFDSICCEFGKYLLAGSTSNV